MTPDEVGSLLAEHLGADCRADVSFGQVTVDVPPSRWVEAATFVRADERLACGFFDWLSAYDDLDEGFAVVLHVWSNAHRHHLLLRTHVPRDTPRLATLTGVYRGASWHERETFEMFGIVFDGHANLVPLLLPDGFEGHPLRKEFVLAARVAKPWPGAKEPGESEHEVARAGRRRMLPPGVPEDWGAQEPAAEPAAGAAPDAGEGS